MTVARLVMAMGTKRERAAATMASTAASPSWKRRLASSTRRMPLDTAMPMTIRMPISAVMEKPCPAAISASTMPTSDTGMVKSMTKGRRSDLNCEAMIMNTTITARPSASPRPREGGAHELDLPDEVVRRCRACAGPRASAASRSAATLPMSRPSVCMSTCAARCEVVALDGDGAEARAGSLP